jgi:hypothetical protein
MSRRPPAALRRSSSRRWLATGGVGEFFEQAADALAASRPYAARLVIGRQGHVADPNAVMPVLERLLGS